MTRAGSATGERAPLDRLFKPRSIAVVGASPEVGNPRNSIVRVLLRTGFPGSLYLVHPKHEVVEGVRCHPDLASLPEVPDLALVITPARTVPGVIEDCGAKGIRAAIVYSAGFEETAQGRELAAELARTAERHGVAVLGANCQGAWSIADRAILSFGAGALRLEETKHAPVAVLSQSGALGGALGLYLQTQAIGCAYFMSVGNETRLDILDCLAWVVEQDDVKVAALYVEALKDGARLLPIAERARERGVQIVALKAGNSELGRSATASHTGKIASAHSVYRRVFDQAGILAVDSFAELIAAIEALTYLPAPRATGDRQGGVAVLSISGGACALLADHAEQLGVPMAEWSPDTARALEDLFPAFGRSANPADMTGQIRSQPTLLDDSLALMADDPRTEAFVMQFSSSGRADLERKGALFVAAAREKRLPVLMSFAGEQPEAEVRAAYRENGVLFREDPAATVRTLSWLYERERFRGRAPRTPRPALAVEAAPRDWPETMALLDACGIGVPGWRILKPSETAAEGCRGLRHPLAVKALPSDAEHKTELGLVALGVASADEVDRHAAAFRAAMGRPGAGILVQEMVGGGVETVLSCLRRTDFGPVLTLGLGGIGIELFRDVTHLALPADEAQVREALRSLKLWTLLDGFRGRPPADVDALAAAAVSFGDRFLASPEIVELEINPLLVMPRGDGLIALDALLSLDEPA